MKHEAGKSKGCFVGVERERNRQANQMLNYLHHLLCRVEKGEVIHQKYRGIKVLFEVAQTFRPLMTTRKH